MHTRLYNLPCKLPKSHCSKIFEIIDIKIMKEAGRKWQIFKREKASARASSDRFPCPCPCLPLSLKIIEEFHKISAVI